MAFGFGCVEPPLLTRLKNVLPSPTFDDFGENEYFMANSRGYEHRCKIKPKHFEPLLAAVFCVWTPVVDHVRAPASYRLHLPERRYRDTNLCRPSKYEQS